jgi:hypothetical protein
VTPQLFSLLLTALPEKSEATKYLQIRSAQFRDCHAIARNDKLDNRGNLLILQILVQTIKKPGITGFQYSMKILLPKISEILKSV